MNKVFLSPSDRQLILDISSKGLLYPNLPQWNLVRLALARSLQINEAPNEELDDVSGEGKGSELHMDQITGYGKLDGEDYTDIYRLILSEYHNEDLFNNDDLFVTYLRRHIRRGLKEFHSSWRHGNDFHDYLFHEMFNVHTPSMIENEEIHTDNIAHSLKELEIKAHLVDVVSGPRLSRHIYKLADAGDFERFRRGLDRLEFLTGLNPLGLVDNLGERKVGLDVPKPAHQWKFPSISDIDISLFRSGALPVAPGVDIAGHPFVFDLAETPHLFVAGTTGSGKSICLHAIIYSLLLNADNVKLVLADPKQVEFAPYRDLKCLWNSHVVCDHNEITDVLNNLVGEMEKRQATLLEARSSNIAQLQALGYSIPRIVVIIEELADLFMQNDEASTTCIRLAQKARATGIHLVLATQRPDSETFPGLLRSNIPSRISLSVRTAQESRIIIDEVGAERLLGKGDMIIRLIQGQAVRVHGFNVTQSDVTRIIENSNKLQA